MWHGPNVTTACMNNPLAHDMKAVTAAQLSGGRTCQQRGKRIADSAYAAMWLLCAELC